MRSPRRRNLPRPRSAAALLLLLFTAAACDRAPSPREATAPSSRARNKGAADLDGLEARLRIVELEKRVDTLEAELAVGPVTRDHLELELLLQRVAKLEVDAAGPTTAAATMATGAAPPPAKAGAAPVSRPAPSPPRAVPRPAPVIVTVAVPTAAPILLSSIAPPEPLRPRRVAEPASEPPRPASAAAPPSVPHPAAIRRRRHAGPPPQPSMKSMLGPVAPGPDKAPKPGFLH